MYRDFGLQQNELLGSENQSDQNGFQYLIRFDVPEPLNINDIVLLYMFTNNSRHGEIYR